ncbi:YccF domain-containing protein [Snodgrassella sp. CFCC 13594]|uniref:YccF domain-containing protein n=1 Tax=Snodgrassella sp. CFCC 13594 TaxID=1775559 RepID=UPI00082AFD9F|nr:YccF domain-containing protein [Snodgrassella sp. CFCC 13594]
MLSFLMNVLWLLLGGVWMALGWWLAALIMAITIIGLPWARSCWVIGQFVLWPFGQQAVNRHELTGQHDLGTGSLGCLGNVVWFVLAGWWLALGHLFSACLNFMTIIGIPFGIQHLKFAALSLAPVGKTIVSKKTGQPLW